MTSLKLSLVCGVLLAAISVANRDLSVAPAQPFWELQGAAPGARESAGLAEFRAAARHEAAPATLVAAR